MDGAVFLLGRLGVEGGGIYCRQVARGNLVLGGGSGFWLDADRARSERGAIASLTQQAIELLPALKHAHFIRTWSGTEGYLPDRQPVLCQSRTTPGLIHGFGFAGAGFQIGPAVGEVLAELARDGQTSTPIDAASDSALVSRALTGITTDPVMKNSSTSVASATIPTTHHTREASACVKSIERAA